MQKIRLRTILIVPFVIQIVGAVGIVGYLSFRNGERAVDSVALQLCKEISERINQELQTFITIPHAVNQNNATAIELGHINVRDLESLRRYFWQQVQIFKSISDIGLGNAQGEVIAVSSVENGTGSFRISDAETGYNMETYAVDAQGEPTTLIKVTNNFNPKERPWYRDAARAGKPTWTEIFPRLGDSDLTISAAQPIYSSQGELEAVLYILMPLSQISSFLRSLDIGKTGQSFIIQPDGALVATSTDEQPFRQTETAIERMQVTDSRDPITRSTGHYLLSKFGDFSTINRYQQFKFEMNQEQYFLQILPLRDDKGLDWLVVVVIPETDFMAQIYANNRNTILLCLLAFGTATIAGIVTARYITQPISHLNTFAQSIAAGQLEHQPEHQVGQKSNVQNIDELEQLRRSFHQMAQQLQQSFRELETGLALTNQRLQQEVQERKQTEAALWQSREQLRMITDSVPAGIAYVDAERRYQFVNKVYELRFNRPRETIVGKYVWEIIGQEAYQNVKTTIDQVLAGQQKSTEFDITYESGNTSYISSLLSPAFDESGIVTGYYLVFFDITERRNLENSLKKANDELERLASLDGLTQIANRRKFDEYLMQEWRRLIRTLNPLSLIIFDVDCFKRYNDFYGHQAGDACLIQVAQVAAKVVQRPADLVTRYGGEEFAVILPDTDRQGAIVIAEHIQQAIRSLAIPHTQSEVSEIITVSLGIASVIPTPELSPDDLITRADQALYAAKQQGRDRYLVAD